MGSMTERPISWMALEEGTSVHTSDGAELGTVAEVVADGQKDIFSGIVVRSGLFSEKRFVPADLIEEMTTEAVKINLDSKAADARLEPYS